MRFATVRPKFWPFGFRAADEAVARDADKLVASCGEGAYDIAATMAWREDVGLLSAPRPGHWERVKREIGHRQGRFDGASRMNAAA